MAKFCAEVHDILSVILSVLNAALETQAGR